MELVRVFATDEMGRYLFAKSLLDREEIEYIAKGETLRNVEGWSPSGWLDIVRGPAELWVRSEDAERAQSVLRALDAPRTDSADDSTVDA
jgi:Putative prokaryotic signal transducing protein